MKPGSGGFVASVGSLGVIIDPTPPGAKRPASLPSWPTWDGIAAEARHATRPAQADAGVERVYGKFMRPDT